MIMQRRLGPIKSRQNVLTTRTPPAVVTPSPQRACTKPVTQQTPERCACVTKGDQTLKSAAAVSASSSNANDVDHSLDTLVMLLAMVLCTNVLIFCLMLCFFIVYLSRTRMQ